MKKLHDYYKELKKDCERCKTEFKVWVRDKNFNQDQEEGVQSSLLQYCPACRVIEKNEQS